MLEKGMNGTVNETVTENNTAKNVGSGSLAVFATPAMVALMEKAACKALEGGLDEGSTTVGTKLNISHIAATPVGMNVSCKATLTEIDGRRLVFEVIASDEKEVIGKGLHERFIVFSEKFVAKAEAKKGN